MSTSFILLVLVATRVAIRVRHEGKFTTVVMLVESTVVELISVPLSVILMVYDISPVSPSRRSQVKVTLTGVPSLAGSTTAKLKLAGSCNSPVNRGNKCIRYKKLTICTVHNLYMSTLLCNFIYLYLPKHWTYKYTLQKYVLINPRCAWAAQGVTVVCLFLQPRLPAWLKPHSFNVYGLPSSY